MHTTPASSRWLLHTFAVALTAAAGCGISDATEGAFSNTGSGGPGGSGTTTTATGTGTTTSTGPDPTTSTSTSTGGEGGNGAGGGATTTTTTTATGPIDGTVDCGDGLTCPQQLDSACCWFSQTDTGECVQGPPSDATCNTSQDVGGFHTRIECELPEQCPGMMCCGDRVLVGGGSYYKDVTCKPQCEWPDIVICDPANPNCPVVTTQQGQTVQTVCQASQVLPGGFNVCGLP